MMSKTINQASGKSLNSHNYLSKTQSSWQNQRKSCGITQPVKTNKN